MLDSNTFYLNEYEHSQSILETQWENTMKEKQEAVVELAIKLIKQETTVELFNWVFSEYVDSDDINLFYDDLAAIQTGSLPIWFDKTYIIPVALEGSCMSLYDCELDEIVPHGVDLLIKQVLEGLK
jgi:hypothetical protein